jgi:hypothetical protein
MEDFTESEPSYPVAYSHATERSYPSSNLGHLALVNAPLLGFIALLMLASSRAEGYLGGLGELLGIFGLVGLGTLLNLVLSGTTKGSRVGYVLMAALYGSVFFFFAYVFSNMGNLKPGG